MTRTTFQACIVLATASLLLSGCGDGRSGHEDKSSKPSKPAKDNETVSDAAAGTPENIKAETDGESTDSSSLPEVGEFTLRGGGDALIEGSVTAGELVTWDDIDPDAASSCPVSGDMPEATVVALHTSIQIKYTGGTIPTQLSADPYELFQGGVAAAESEVPAGGAITFNDGSSWQCVTSEGVDVDLSPGETKTLDFWRMNSGVLSNEHPAMTSEMISDSGFDPSRLSNAEFSRPGLSGHIICIEGTSAILLTPNVSLVPAHLYAGRVDDGECSADSGSL